MSATIDDTYAEAFRSIYAEVLVTARDAHWLDIAARHATGNASSSILCDCEAGVSRSSAAALIMYACWLGPGREREAMERVLAQRPVAVPNRRMVGLADRLLDRGGCLIGVLG